MSRSAVEALGNSRDQADRMVDAFSELDRSAMLLTAEHHDPAIPAHENEMLLATFRERRAGWEADLAERMKTIMAEPKK
jgi:CPA2 family monovalent cation:H+ antiporter-2